MTQKYKFNTFDTLPKKGLIATKVSGKSMQPIFMDGALVILEKMTDISEFKDNNPYVILVENIPPIKNIRLILPGDQKGKFEVSSYNEDLKQIVDKQDITAWCKVTHVINPI